MSHDINIHHITRVEGHGNIVLNIREGRIEELRLEIVESPRFFEVMLIGRNIREAPHITSRICGICAISHTSASIKACEVVLGVNPPEDVVLLRKILMNAEALQSHILHIYLLVAPDLFGVESVIHLANSNPELVKRGLRLKKAANDISRVLVGRHVHPIGMTIGGFTRTPTRKDLDEVQRILEGAIPDMEETVKFFEEIRMPEFNRQAKYCSLQDKGEYALYDGLLYSKDAPPLMVQRYKEFISEGVVAYSTAKHVRSGDSPIMVGALARLNNNYANLSSQAKEAAERLGLSIPCTNPFMNNIAQVVESVHCIYDSLRLINLLGSNPPIPNPPLPPVIIGAGLPLLRSIATGRGGLPKIQPGEGVGVGVVEAPRGTLYHEYGVDDEGVILSANCIIPTAQNLLNIEKDIEAIVPMIIDLPKKDIERRLEMLVRAYDPCISCSTHFLEVKFVE
ncbi:MAG: Ni/Fe hydrogenase subunit alpha [Nitrospirae bacterium]|nr:Ni/Fe hydrogenase subunit alpha [Nitrospirota bacterium]